MTDHIGQIYRTQAPTHPPLLCLQNPPTHLQRASPTTGCQLAGPTHPMRVSRSPANVRALTSGSPSAPCGFTSAQGRARRVNLSVLAALRPLLCPGHGPSSYRVPLRVRSFRVPRCGAREGPTLVHGGASVGAARARTSPTRSALILGDHAGHAAWLRLLPGACWRYSELGIHTA